MASKFAPGERMAVYAVVGFWILTTIVVKVVFTVNQQQKTPAEQGLKGFLKLFVQGKF
jgi:hypothetical protein